ncbi:MAG: N-acetylmuramoyl-L-alanine amidase [Gammaproteobacteria bacterium]|nr:N-acetylmuramoyl-L-alanine amidase [Gammaproteobacteria bacterium]
MRWLVFCCSFGLSQVAFAAQVQGLRVWHAPDQTRLVFDLSDAIGYDAYLVENPPRLVLDLRAAALVSELKLPAAIKDRVPGLRYSVRGGRDLRIVFDLAHRVALHEALLAPHAPYGHRLVVDLLDAVPKPSATVAAAMPRPASSTIAASASRPEPATTTDQALTLANSPKFVVAIDAGHGGEDVGAIGPHGTYEKDVVLLIARELARRINAEPTMRAVLIRDGDYYVGLRDRMVRARDKKADLFVSIHADAFSNHRVRGSSVYVLSPHGATSEAARWLADRENAADLVGGVTLEDKDQVLRSVLLDLSQTASIETSRDVAGNVLRALRRVGAVHREQVQSAGFMVLKSPDIPSLLVETAFISNPTEEQQLQDAGFREKLADAIQDGIKSFIASRPLSAQRFAEAH